MAVSIEGFENSVAVPDIIAREALYRLKHHLVIPLIANKTFNEYFEGKIGDSITIKRPFKAKVQDGRIMKKSAIIDKTITVSIDQRKHFALEVVDEDVTLNIVDYGKRYLDAGAEELAYAYEIAGAKELAGGLFIMDGTPGTALSLDQTQLIRAHATKMAIPRNSQNFALLDPLDIAQVSSEIIDVDMPEMVGENIREAYRGKLSGWHVMESVHVPYLEVAAVPTTAAPLIMGASQRGSEITTDGWPTNEVKILNMGQLIQIAGVKEVQPRGDRRVTGNLATFVVREDVTPSSAGVATIKIYPDINAGTVLDTVTNPSNLDFDGTTAKGTLDASAFQTVDTVPADNAAITIIGRVEHRSPPAQTFRQGIYFCGDALEYVNVTLAKPKTANYAGVERDPETGVSISYMADFDITEATEAERLDIFFGTKTVYPESRHPPHRQEGLSGELGPGRRGEST